MGLHLAEIATMVSPGRHAVLLLDQAAWHLSAALTVPPNITLLPLPPKCPELNVMENVWQFMRDNWLSNRVFATYDDIVAHCCEAWNKLTDQPWHIISIGMRDGRVPGRGVGAVGKSPAVATAESLAEAGDLSTAVVTVAVLGRVGLRDATLTQGPPR